MNNYAIIKCYFSKKKKNLTTFNISNMFVSCLKISRLFKMCRLPPTQSINSKL